MDRKDVLNSPEYWTSKTQIELYNQAQNLWKQPVKTGHTLQSIWVCQKATCLNYSMVITTTACQSSSNWH